MKRGEIWLLNLDPIIGREPSGTRPALVISVEPFNNSGLELVVVCPLTSRNKGFPTHVPVKPEETGLSRVSFIKTEDIKSISSGRFIKRLGIVPPKIMTDVETRLKRILGLN
jgi:mRNA interferase MazF